MTAHSYYALEATAPWSDPVWPDESFNQLLKLAFHAKIIASMDHPVIQTLSGQS
jgi:hypothetical protein